MSAVALALSRRTAPGRLAEDTSQPDDCSGQIGTGKALLLGVVAFGAGAYAMHASMKPGAKPAAPRREVDHRAIERAEKEVEKRKKKAEALEKQWADLDDSLDAASPAQQKAIKQRMSDVSRKLKAAHRVYEDSKLVVRELKGTA